MRENRNTKIVTTEKKVNIWCQNEIITLQSFS